ncbi:hypothetical protein Q8G50_33685, partial [Klebsiella pneumoniae]
MKLVLRIFEQLSDLKLIFTITRYFFGHAVEQEHIYKEIFGSEVGSLSFGYLRVPIHHRRLRNSEWNPVENRFE